MSADNRILRKHFTRSVLFLVLVGLPVFLTVMYSMARGSHHHAEAVADVARLSVVSAMEHHSSEGVFPSDPELVSKALGLDDRDAEFRVSAVSGGDNHYIAILRGDGGRWTDSAECAIGFGLLPTDLDEPLAGMGLANSVVCQDPNGERVLLDEVPSLEDGRPGPELAREWIREIEG